MEGESAPKSLTVRGRRARLILLEATMRHLLPLLALVCFAVGCGSSEPDPEENQPGNNADPRATERAQIRGKLNAKRRELDAANSDLSKIASEREELADQPASNQK